MFGKVEVLFIFQGLLILLHLVNYTNIEAGIENKEAGMKWTGMDINQVNLLLLVLILMLFA